MVPDVIAAGKACSYSREGVLQRLRTYVLEHGAVTIANEFDALQGKPEATEFLRGACAGTRPTADPQQNAKFKTVRLALFKRALAWLTSPDEGVTSEQATAMVSVLSDTAPFFSSPADLSAVVEAALETFESNGKLAYHALDLLPPALTVLHNLGGSCGADEDQVSDVFRGAAARICTHAWPPASIAPTLAALRALPMSAEALAAAVRHGAALAMAADVLDLLAIAHQLLALAGPTCKGVALAEIVRLFDKRERSAAESTNEAHRKCLLQIEGAVLMEMEPALKHDAELGRAWLKRLKSPWWQPSPFALAVSMVIASSDAMEKHIVAALRASLTKVAADRELRRAAPWLPAAADAPQSAALEEALLQCTRNAALGQGAVVVRPLVSFAVSLLEAGVGGKLVSSNISASSRCAADLGVRVLTTLFGAHKECRKDVLKLCCMRLLGASEASAPPFLALLRSLVARYPALVELHLAEVRMVLENLVTLPPAASMALLLALWPICSPRKDLKNDLVIMLRKAQFNRDMGARLFAARGFLFLITEQLKGAAAGGGGGGDGASPAGGGPSFSQMGDVPALSQMSALAGGPRGVTLMIELMGLVRRCLTQQAEVRAAVYVGLPAVLAADPAAAEMMAELLLPHAAAFCEAEEALPPLKLEACMPKSGGATPVEPVHLLMACVAHVVRMGRFADAPATAKPVGVSVSDNEDDTPQKEAKSAAADSDEEDDYAAGPALHRLFASVRCRLGRVDLEDLGFDASTVFASSEPQGPGNQVSAHMLLGCFEVAMEDVVADIQRIGTKPRGDAACRQSEELAAELLQLHRQHLRLSNLVADGAKGVKGKKMEGLTQAVGGAAAAAKDGPAVPLVGQRHPVLSVGCMSSLLEAIERDGLVPNGCAAGQAQSAHVELARSVEFQTFTMNGCMRMLQQKKGGTGASAEEEEDTEGSGDDANSAAATARLLCGSVDWRVLAGPLFKTAAMTVLACCSRAPAESAGEKKKEKDPIDGLLQVSVAAFERLLARGGGTLEGVARLMRPFHLPSDDTKRKARLPQVAEGATVDSPLAVVTARLPHFRVLLNSLVKNAKPKELESMCACLKALLGVLPPAHVKAMATWLDAACAEAPTQLSTCAAAVQALVALRLQCHAAAGGDADLVLLVLMAEDARRRVEGDGGCYAATLNFTAQASSPLLSAKSVNKIVEAAAAHIEAALGPLNYALTQIQALGERAAADGDDNSGNSAVGGALVQAASRAEWENATFGRMLALVRAATAVTSVSLIGKPAEEVVKALIKVYATLKKAAGTQMASKGQQQPLLGPAFLALKAKVNSDLSPAVDNLKSELQMSVQLPGPKAADAEEGAEEDENEGGNAGKRKKKKDRETAAARKRPRNEIKALPNLNFHMESWLVELVKVSKATRVNLMEGVRFSKNVDFRLNTAKRTKVERAAVEQQQQQAEEEEEEEDEEVAAEEDDEEMEEAGEEEEGGEDVFGEEEEAALATIYDE